MWESYREHGESILPFLSILRYDIIFTIIIISLPRSFFIGIFDLSPYSIKTLLNTFHPYGLMDVAHRYSVRDFRLFCRLGGAEYRVLARLDHRRPRRYSRLGVMELKLLSPSYPLDFWLGKGRPLSPEAHGRLVRLLRAKLKPWELVLPPDELFRD
ncbi:hypothetical protein L6452_39515 [Arctium lappa]|uniref:Uncharacterized protein n=1 Tax=Arctium lappa TaxID=4217 RepID=A0ACB8XU71_ARCLA|nr:hypothetical protein L6452_39515 [Arctium lappa]